MKISRVRLNQIIKEEYEKVVSEEDGTEQATQPGMSKEELLAAVETELKEIFADFQHAGVNVKEAWGDIKTRIMTAYKFAAGQEE